MNDLSEAAIAAILAELQSDLPGLYDKTADTVAGILISRGLRRPKFVALPSKVKCGGRCSSCCSSEDAHGFVESDFRAPTEHTDLITTDGQVKDGAAMYSANCPKCATTFFISYCDHRSFGANAAKQTTRKFYDDTLLGPVLRVGQRVLIFLAEVCALCDRNIYYSRGSMSSIARVLTFSGELPSDDLRLKELNNAWFLYFVLRLRAAFGQRVTMTWSVAGQPLLNDAIASLVDKLFTEGYSYDFKLGSPPRDLRLRERLVADRWLREAGRPRLPRRRLPQLPAAHARHVL